MVRRKHAAGIQRRGFVSGVFLSLLLCVLGFAIEFMTGGGGVSLPSWPGNLYLLLLMLSVIIPTALLFRESGFVQWLGGIPLGLCLIVAVIETILSSGKGNAYSMVLGNLFTAIYSSITRCSHSLRHPASLALRVHANYVEYNFYY